MDTIGYSRKGLFHLWASRMNTLVENARNNRLIVVDDLVPKLCQIIDQDDRSGV